MTKRSRKNTRKIRNLIIVCVITSFVFVISTYAWFIGMRTVNVDSFDVKIAVTDSLLLSLDGKKWNTTVEINGTNFNDPNVVYEKNANTWSNGGLIPVSSVGEMDPKASRMMLYEKGSLTSTEGGYRLMASRMDNYTTQKQHEEDTWQYDEERGYVAFDLFVKNFSGRAYYAENNPANEEAIYLTTDSAVTVAQDGVQNTGIENSVRVAFAQIGRVNAETNDPDTITSIKCEGTTPVTGIVRRAQIWEPNETKHVQAAIDNFAETCKKRNTGNDVFASGAYTDETCAAISDGTAYPTYAINRVIGATSTTDIYDGLNNYTTNVTNKTINGEFGAVDPVTGKDQYATSDKDLFAYKTFTDADKMIGEGETGPTDGKNQRPTFITLAPNSITKIRVYVYIEGQDVDNFDLASIGKRINVQFGFTKDRYDFNDKPIYNDNVVNVPDDSAEDKKSIDEIAPIISFTDDSNVQNGGGVNTLSLTKAEAKEFDPLKIVTATDNLDKDITDRITVTHHINPDVADTYLVSYLVSDWSGNYNQLELNVTVTE